MEVKTDHSPDACKDEKVPRGPAACAAHHFTGFMLHGAHFVPYSFPLYPLIAFLRAIADRSPKAATTAIWTLYTAGLLAYACYSYFFRYSYVYETNLVFFYTATAAGFWAAGAALARRHAAGYVPFIIIVILNTVLPNSRPLFTAAPGKFAAVLALTAALIALRGHRKQLGPAVLLAATAIASTGNSVLPLAVALFSLAAVFIGLKNGLMAGFNPAVHGFSVFHLLLFLGLSQFYSNSLPRTLDTIPVPDSVVPVRIYGGGHGNLSLPSGNDNRFLSTDETGEHLFFGRRMNKPDLFMISRYGPVNIVAATIDNTSDNIVLTPDGRYLIAGSFGKKTLEKFRIDDFLLEKTVKIGHTPIRLAVDTAAGEIFSIGEFKSGILEVRDADSLRLKRELSRRPENRNFRDLAVDPVNGRLIIVQWLDLVLYDSRTLKELSRTRTANRGLGRLAADPVNKIVYLTHTTSGKLLAFSYENDRLKRTGEFDLGFGVRDVAFDPAGNRVAAANYFTGILTLLDMEKEETVFRAGLGNRMRHVEFGKNGGEILTTTMAGGFIVDTEKAALEYKLSKARGRVALPDIIMAALRMTSPPRFFDIPTIQKP